MSQAAKVLSVSEATIHNLITNGQLPVIRFARSKRIPVWACEQLVGLAVEDEASLRDLIQEARRRDLLSKMPRGQAGGELTAKAKKLLSDGSGEERAPE